MALTTDLRRPGQPRDYYALLGLEDDASFREIEAAYWRQALARRDALPLLNEAYEVLGNADRRAAYDAQRRTSKPPGAPLRTRREASPGEPGAVQQAPVVPQLGHSARPACTAARERRSFFLRQSVIVE